MWSIFVVFNANFHRMNFFYSSVCNLLLWYDTHTSDIDRISESRNFFQFYYLSYIFHQDMTSLSGLRFINWPKEENLIITHFLLWPSQGVGISWQKVAWSDILITFPLVIHSIHTARTENAKKAVEKNAEKLRTKERNL